MLNELVRWNPFDEELSSWHRDIDDLFGRFFGRPALRLTGGLPPRLTVSKGPSGPFDFSATTKPVLSRYPQQSYLQQTNNNGQISQNSRQAYLAGFVRWRNPFNPDITAWFSLIT